MRAMMWLQLLHSSRMWIGDYWLLNKIHGASKATTNDKIFTVPSDFNRFYRNCYCSWSLEQLQRLRRTVIKKCLYTHVQYYINRINVTLLAYTTTIRTTLSYNIQKLCMDSSGLLATYKLLEPKRCMIIYVNIIMQTSRNNYFLCLLAFLQCQQV